MSFSGISRSSWTDSNEAPSTRKPPDNVNRLSIMALEDCTKAPYFAILNADLYVTVALPNPGTKTMFLVLLLYLAYSPEMPAVIFQPGAKVLARSARNLFSISWLT